MLGRRVETTWRGMTAGLTREHLLGSTWPAFSLVSLFVFYLRSDAKLADPRISTGRDYNIQSTASVRSDQPISNPVMDVLGRIKGALIMAAQKRDLNPLRKVSERTTEIFLHQ